MKKYILFTLLFCATLVMGQQKSFKKADQLFQDMHYLEAANQYSLAFEEGNNTKELLQNAGDANYYNSNMYEASLWYDKLFKEHEENEVDSRYAFRYIQSLLGSNQLEKALKTIGYFSESDLLSPLQVAQLQKQAEMSVEDILAMPASFRVRKTKINAPFSDFGPMFYGDKIVFASARDTMDLHTREYHWNEQPYLDFYTAKSNAKNGNLSDVTPFSAEINTKYHEGGLSFSPDLKTVYFTRNNYQGNLKRDEEGVNHLNLYRAVVKATKDGKDIWGDVTELPFNNITYSVGHPAVSPDGKTLYFVSDMPGGLGATDIYKVNINQDGSFSEPVNLGETINTAGREMFPFMSAERFYFSSDGHFGLGALDVFETVVNEEGNFVTPKNLAAPLNSTLDDFGFIINEETQMGYFSSNRKGGIGDDDIYSFKRNKIEPVIVCEQTANGTVLNEYNKKPIPGADVSLFDASGKLIEQQTTAADGTFNFDTVLSCETSYVATAKKERFGEDSKEFQTTAELDLELGLQLSVAPIIDDIYEVNGVKKFRIENLNFDLNKYNIRPDAATELEKIVRVMTEYPTIVIKIESHTDSRGSDAYNERLSDQRAKSTRDYIISRGIAANRIESAIGYGEKQLLNECGNGVLCSNEKHDINRRSDFIIIKM